MEMLTKQEKRFVAEVAEHGNKTLAAQTAFGIKDTNYASVKSVRLLGKDRIVNAIQDALSDELLLQVHLEGLQAMKEEPTADKEGKPDYAVRHKYLDSAYKLKGSFAPNKHVNLNLTADVPNEKLKKLADKLNGRG